VANSWKARSSTRNGSYAASENVVVAGLLDAVTMIGVGLALFFTFATHSYLLYKRRLRSNQAV